MGEALLVHLGLGTNLGDRWANLAGAVGALQAVDERLVVSPIYETAPVGGPADQGPYLNCVVRLICDLNPLGVLDLARRLETSAGRRRSVRWGPRTLDVDVLVLALEVGRAGSRPLTIETEDLVVPHPRMAERAFVLAPLEDVSPELVDEGWRERLGGRRALEGTVRRVGELVGRSG